MMLFAWVAICAAVAPADSAVEAVKDAASAAPCIACLVMYQAATSVPRPTVPMIPESDSAKMTADEPLRSAATAAIADDGRRSSRSGLSIGRTHHYHVG